MANTNTEDGGEMSQILFTNLQLLGMDVIDMEDKYKIQFNKDMFNLPNKAGSEAVLYFLFNRLNPSLCKEQFRDCWPVFDRKTEFQFRKVCNSWLVCIQKDEPNARLPSINAALLLSPGGRKFIKLLHSFSTYVLVQVMKNEHGHTSELMFQGPIQNDPQLSNATAKTLHNASALDRENLFDHLHCVIAANRKWREYCQELTKEYRGLVKKGRESQTEKLQCVNTLAETAMKAGCSLPARRSLSMFDGDTDVYAAKRRQKMQKVQSQWKMLSNFSEGSQDHRELIRQMLEGTLTTTVLDGTDLGVRVPGLLLRECKKEISQNEIESVYIGGKVNLPSVLQLWNICLKLYKEQLESEPLPNVTEQAPQLRHQLKEHHALQSSTKNISNNMSKEVIPELTKLVQRLQKLLQNQPARRSARDEHQYTPLNLGLTSNTPDGAVPMNFPSGADSTPRGTAVREGLEGAMPTRLSHLLDSASESPDGPSRLASQLEAQVQQARKVTRPQKSVDFGGLVPRKSSSGSHASSKKNKVKQARGVPGKLQAGHPGAGTVRPTSHNTPGSVLRETLETRGKDSHRKAESASSSQAGIVKKSKMNAQSAESKPKSSTASEKAMNALADSIVADVLGLDEGDASPDRLGDLLSPLLSHKEEESFSPGQLDGAAFVSRDLLTRSPLRVTPHSSASTSGGPPRGMTLVTNQSRQSDSSAVKTPRAVHSAGLSCEDSTPHNAGLWGAGSGTVAAAASSDRGTFEHSLENVISPVSDAEHSEDNESVHDQLDNSEGDGNTDDILSTKFPLLNQSRESFVQSAPLTFALDGHGRNEAIGTAVSPAQFPDSMLPSAGDRGSPVSSSSPTPADSPLHQLSPSLAEVWGEGPAQRSSLTPSRIPARPPGDGEASAEETSPAPVFSSNAITVPTASPPTASSTNNRRFDTFVSDKEEESDSDILDLGDFSFTSYGSLSGSLLQTSALPNTSLRSSNFVTFDNGASRQSTNAATPVRDKTQNAVNKIVSESLEQVRMSFGESEDSLETAQPPVMVDLEDEDVDFAPNHSDSFSPVKQGIQLQGRSPWRKQNGNDRGFEPGVKSAATSGPGSAKKSELGDLSSSPLMYSVPGVPSPSSQSNVTAANLEAKLAQLRSQVSSIFHDFNVDSDSD